MKKYYYIFKNAYREKHLSLWVMLLQIPQPLLEMYGFALFYNYVIYRRSSMTDIPSDIAIYFLFILTASCVRLPSFSEDIHQDIVDESYLNIEKLPINPTSYYILNSIAGYTLNLIIFMAISLIYMVIHNYSFVSIILFIPTVFIGIILGHLIYIIFTTFNFYTETASVWLFRVIFDFFSGRWVPIPFTPILVQTILYFLPFSYAYGALAKTFSNFTFTSWLSTIIIAIVWLIALQITATKLWTKGSYYFQENG